MNVWDEVDKYDRGLGTPRSISINLGILYAEDLKDFLSWVTDEHQMFPEITMEQYNKVK